MTRDQLEAIVREWQRRLNIPHWRVIINWNKIEESDKALARVARDGDGYEGATLSFAPEWRTWSVQETNEIIAHELTHMLMHDLEMAGVSAEEVLTGTAWRLFNHRFEHELEGVVDKLALLLVQFAGPFDPAREETLDVQHRTAA